MSLKHVILGLLADQPLHGYELKALFDKELSASAALNFGQVYTTLDRLERDGWVTHDRVSQNERPDRKVYGVTPAGREALQAWLDTPAPPHLDLRNATFLKLMLARRLPHGSWQAVLQRERAACFERLHDVSRARAAADAEGGKLATRALFDLAVRRLDAFIRWLDHLETLFDEENGHD